LIWVFDMTIEEAIIVQKVIKRSLKEIDTDQTYKEALMPLMEKSCDVAIFALNKLKRSEITDDPHLFRF